MRTTGVFLILGCAASAHATRLFDRNLVYSSPFKGFREVTRHFAPDRSTLSQT